MTTIHPSKAASAVEIVTISYDSSSSVRHFTFLRFKVFKSDQYTVTCHGQSRHTVTVSVGFARVTVTTPSHDDSDSLIHFDYSPSSYNTQICHSPITKDCIIQSNCISQTLPIVLQNFFLSSSIATAGWYVCLNIS